MENDKHLPAKNVMARCCKAWILRALSSAGVPEMDDFEPSSAM